jgi:DNA uptake protein ComE-like DNA-binding protein
MNATLHASLLVAAVALVACKPSELSAAYLAVCEGQPLRTGAHRHQAIENGYEINRQYDCVTKRSATAVAAQNAQWAAEHTPTVMAARRAEVDRHNAESKLRDAMRAQAEVHAVAVREQRRVEDKAAVIEQVEVNTATAAQLAKLEWLDAEVARQIVAERMKRRFDNWTDMVKRVDGLSTVETGMRASAFGLTVNGSSLKGAEPASSMARYMRRWRVQAPSP